MKLIQSRIKPILNSLNALFDGEKSKEIDDLSKQINEVLIRDVDSNMQRVEAWGNRVLTVTHSFLHMGG